MDDPFSLLGLPRRYALDRAALESAYLSRSAAFHPDVVGDSSFAPDDRSAELNQARQTLQDPERRAVALWSLLVAAAGNVVKPDEKALPPGFLLQVMQWREELDEARASRDAASLAAFERLAEARRAEHELAVAALFGKATSTPPPATLDALLGQIRLELNAWRYTERLLEQLDG